MAFKEVTALRKSGKLEQALEMARADYNHLQDYWGCVGLFWCLNDKYKLVKELVERDAIVKEMHELAKQIQRSDEYIERALVSADRSLLPHQDEIRTAEEQAKNGDALAAYNKVLSFQNDDELASVQYENFGWIIYRALHQNQQISTIERRRILNNYLKLELPSPSMLHSCILSEAMNTERINPNEFLFTRFIEIWNLENLRDEDWQDGKTQDGNRYPSQVERMITLYSKEIQVVSTALPSETFMSVLQKAIDKWPDNDNLLRDKAIALIKLGKKEEAIGVYKQLVLKFSAKFYLWSERAMLVDSDDVKISLLCKALSIKVPEEFLGKLHLALANALIDSKVFDWAKAELDKYKEVYERNNWHLNNTFVDLCRMIPAGTVAIPQEYSDHFCKADALVYSDIPSQIMVKIGERSDQVTDHKTQKQKKVRKWMLLNNNGETIKVKPRQFGFQSLPDGQCFEIKMTDGKIRFVKAIEMPSVNWIKRVSGNVRIKTNSQNKAFAFVDNSYVHERLLTGVNDGDYVEGVAVCRNEKWQCITLTTKGK